MKPRQTPIARHTCSYSNSVSSWSTPRSYSNSTLSVAKIDPYGGGLEYLHRSPCES
jgi:hypothetical protein